jgi:hypothetical protein
LISSENKELQRSKGINIPYSKSNLVTVFISADQPLDMELSPEVSNSLDTIEIMVREMVAKI